MGKGRKNKPKKNFAEKRREKQKVWLPINTGDKICERLYIRREVIYKKE